jgi:hypothetical protein
MKERERNKRFFLLMAKLLSERDEEAIELLGTMVATDTDAMQKIFRIMREKIFIQNFIQNDCTSSTTQKRTS